MRHRMAIEIKRSGIMPSETLAQSTFGNIFLLLQFENVKIELLLELFVGVIDTELLEGVDFERLKAVNVENADEFLPLRFADQSFV